MQDHGASNAATKNYPSILRLNVACRLSDDELYPALFSSDPTFRPAMTMQSPESSPCYLPRSELKPDPFFSSGRNNLYRPVRLFYVEQHISHIVIFATKNILRYKDFRYKWLGRAKGSYTSKTRSQGQLQVVQCIEPPEKRKLGCRP